ncbi:MAG: hypothetical protein M3N18_03700 [Actinomycetota bacterium]|nr:hypothetical protein [Actinomycetota bacterium]
MSSGASQYTKPRGPLALIGAGLILASGVLHLILSPEHFREATYLGVLFLLETAGAAVVAAIGAYRGQRWA